MLLVLKMEIVIGVLLMLTQDKISLLSPSSRRFHRDNGPCQSTLEIIHRPS